MIVIFIILLFLACFFITLNRSSPHCDALKGSIQKIARQMSRYLIAAQQDEDVVIAYAHMSYGIGFMWSLDEIATPSVISEAIGKDYTKVKEEAIAIQDGVIRRMIEKCPEIAPKTRSVLADIARGGMS